MNVVLRLGALVCAICLLAPALALPSGYQELAQTVQQEGALRRGDTGGGVRALQTALTQLGVPLAIDGDFGPSTDKAVRAFQRRVGLSADGIVGPRTARQLDRHVEATQNPTIQDGTWSGVQDPEALVPGPT